MRVAINAAIIQDDKILIVKKKRTWILPGGKPKVGESDLACLIRESDEELNGTELENFEYFNSFLGITPHKGDVLLAKVYFADIKGKLNGYSAEISGAKFVSNTNDYRLSDITSKIIKSLREFNYL